ncbi:MAG: HAD family hydrolase [Thaumarchaeota archaeon]|nr:HAD family hydrolase [Nitrososphaerota archaeon]
MAIKAVIFDLDGTINRSVRYYKAYDDYAMSILAEFLKLPKKQVYAKMQALRKTATGFTKRVELLGMPRSIFYDQMTARIPCDNLIDADVKLKVMLEELRKEGYKLALLTNTGLPLVQKIVAALGIPSNMFAVIATSTDTGLKPDDEPYLYVAHQLSVPLQDCLYVGDRYEMEIETAKRLGMTTALIANSFLEDSLRSGYSDHIIDNIYAVPTLLRVINAKRERLVEPNSSVIHQA